MGYKSFCCLLLLLTGNVSLRAQGIDDISPMAIYNIGLVGCDSIGVNVLKTFISTGEARCVAVFDEKTTLAESTEREITSIQDKAPLLYNDYCKMLDRRDLDIVLVDSEKLFGNENLLPAGPLREGMEGFKRIDKLVIVSKNTDHSRAEKLARVYSKKQGIPTFVAKVEPDYAYNIISGEHLEKGAEVAALSAIGQPEQFYKFLKDYDVLKTITFDDHHQYAADDISSIEGNIITTEKDAVKLALLQRPDIYALKLKTVLDIEKLCYNSEGIKQPDNRA